MHVRTYVLPGLISVCSVMAGLTAPPKLPPASPESISIVRSRAPEADPEGFGRYICLGKKDDGGTGPAVSGVMVVADYLNRENDYLLGDPRVAYPPLRRGDLVPAFGALYRVTGLEDPGVTLRRAGREDTPPAVAFARGSIPLILDADPEREQPKADTLLHRRNVRVVSIKAPPAGGKGGPVAAVRVYYGRGSSEWHEAEVRAGEYLPIRERAEDRSDDPEKTYGHRVVAVVPRDPKAGVIGWVELDAKPLSEAALAKAKAQVVEPKPAAKPR